MPHCLKHYGPIVFAIALTGGLPVLAALSATSLQVSPNPAVYGGVTTLTAVVSPATYPAPVSINPPSGKGTTTTLTFSYQDETSASNLMTNWALIDTSIDGRGACYVAYYRPGNLLFLTPDNGDGSQAASMALTGTNTLSNGGRTFGVARGTWVWN